MLVVHAELCRRAGFSIDWAASAKGGYLDALTREIDDPRGKHLDAYLLPLVKDDARPSDLVRHLQSLPGLGGVDDVDENVAYAADDPTALQAYIEARRGRGETAGDEQQ